MGSRRSEKERWEHALVPAETGEGVDLVLDPGLGLLGLEELLEFFLEGERVARTGVDVSGRESWGEQGRATITNLGSRVELET